MDWPPPPTHTHMHAHSVHGLLQVRFNVSDNGGWDIALGGGRANFMPYGRDDGEDLVEQWLAANGPTAKCVTPPQTILSAGSWDMREQSLLWVVILLCSFIHRVVHPLLLIINIARSAPRIAHISKQHTALLRSDMSRTRRSSMTLIPAEDESWGCLPTTACSTRQTVTRRIRVSPLSST